MYCIHCGKEILDESNVCKECETQKNKEYIKNEIDKIEKSKKKIKDSIRKYEIIILILVVISVLILIESKIQPFSETDDGRGWLLAPVMFIGFPASIIVIISYIKGINNGVMNYTKEVKSLFDQVYNDNLDQESKQLLEKMKKDKDVFANNLNIKQIIAFFLLLFPIYQLLKIFVFR